MLGSTVEKDADFKADVRKRIQFALDECESRKLAKEGDAVIVATGALPGPGYTNSMRVMRFKMDQL